MEVLVQTDLYQLDFAKFYKFFEKADIVKKLNGFIIGNSKEEKAVLGTRSILQHLKEFINLLSFQPEDGVFIIKPQGILHYVCLNPSLTLKRILDEAQKVVLTSGTLEPTEEFSILDEHYPDKSFITKFSCQHILPV